jgi:hypothetical protein
MDSVEIVIGMGESLEEEDLVRIAKQLEEKNLPCVLDIKDGNAVFKITIKANDPTISSDVLYSIYMAARQALAQRENKDDN